MLMALILLTCSTNYHCDLIKVDDNISSTYCHALAQKSLPPTLEGSTLSCVDSGAENDRLRTSAELTSLIKSYIPPVEEASDAYKDNGTYKISL